MIKLEFSVDEVNHILMLLGKLPFADVNMTIRAIVDQGGPQAEALQAAKAAEEETKVSEEETAKE
jgi:hypothetical protein